MRLLVFGDLHLDSAFAWAGPRLAGERRAALRRTLTRICDLAVELGVDALCSAGDLYEQDRFTPDTAALLRSEFARLAPIRVFLAPGNHDYLGPASLYHQVDWSPNVHLFTQPSLQPVSLAEGFTLWGAAHTSPAAADGFLDDFQVRGEGVHLGLFHGSEQGELVFEGSGKRPHAPFRASQIAAAGLCHALVGHFHTPRDAPDHTYPGNPQPLAFGETGERGAVLVTVTPAGTVTRQRHRVAVSEVHDIEVNLDGVRHSGEIFERTAAALAGRRGMARVTLAGEVGQRVDVSLAGLAEAAPEGLTVVPRLGTITVGYDLEALAAEKTVRGRFVQSVRDDPELSPDQRRRILITGLRALDGRRDELEVH